MSNEVEHTHVRYVVTYDGRTYEHSLHSNRRHFIKNMADVVNVIEYCVMRDLKTGDGVYKPMEKLYNYKVTRLVNDAVDESFDASKFKGVLDGIVSQTVGDIVQRNT